jgi:HPt (histidine-containing phosphotransfer) domain-containing protein
VIALSANVSTEEIEHCRSVGIDDFIAKPAPLALLASTLHRYLRLQRLAVSSPAPRFGTAPVSPLESALDRRLIEDFLNTTHDDITALHRALARNDAAAVAREAHRIKGASGLVGATALASAAARIEATGQSGNLAAAPAELRDLETQVACFAEAINARPG